MKKLLFAAWRRGPRRARNTVVCCEERLVVRHLVVELSGRARARACPCRARLPLPRALAPVPLLPLPRCCPSPCQCVCTVGRHAQSSLSEGTGEFDSLVTRVPSHCQGGSAHRAQVRVRHLRSSSSSSSSSPSCSASLLILHFSVNCAAFLAKRSRRSFRVCECGVRAHESCWHAR